MDGSTLTITPGTVVEFKGHYKINVQGVLYAVGKEDDIIQFTVNDTTGFSDIDTTIGGWKGIQFYNGSEGADGAMWDNDTSMLVYCNIEYGKAIDELSDGSGGALYCYRSDPVIRNNEINHNVSLDGGGGIHNLHSDPRVANNTLNFNYADGDGGGICCRYSSPSIVGNNIMNNSGRSGGGIGIFSQYTEVINNVIANNEGRKRI